MGSTGIIFNIQRFSLHDGPGMRTVLFLKGCPLSCRWCSNPESQNSDIELIYYQSRCILCGSCISACDDGSVSLKSGKIYFDRKTADPVRCASVCPTGAMEALGQKKSTDELIPLLLRDAAYFRRSGGGVTISGGEPAMQSDFCAAVVSKLREVGTHTAIETCGYRRWEPFYRAVEKANLILFDLKTIDSERHIEGTGVENELIIENFLKLIALKDISVRIPLIPGFNADDGSMKSLAAFISNSGFKGEVHLLPYHSYGSGKYEALQMDYGMGDAEAPSAEKVESWAYLFEQEGYKTKIHQH